MANGVQWIDDVEIVVQGPVILATAQSGGSRTDYRMGRSAFRAYVERSIRQLDEADIADRCRVLPFDR